MKISAFITVILWLGIGYAVGDDGPPTVTYKVSGLYCEQREDDLRQALQSVSGIKVKSVSYTNAEASLKYTIRPLPLDQLNKLVKPSGFEVKRVGTGDNPRFIRVVIPVVGLDCKGCNLGAYRAVSNIEGVEQATASFGDGRVTALIDPTKTSREALIQALKQKGVAFGADRQK